VKKILSSVLPPLVPFILVVLIAEFLSKKGLIAPYILPAPSDIFLSLKNDFTEYLLACRETLGAALIGLLLSALVGITLAIVLSSSRWIEKALYPYATFFQTVPIVSIAPLLVIWFGFGLRTVVISAFIVSVFPVLANTFSGLRSTDPALVDLFKLYGASKKDTLFKLKLPFAVPQILTGLKISAGLAMIGAVIGEFIAGGGLGGVIDASRTQQRLDKVFAAVLLASFSGVLIVFLLNVIAKYFLKRWRNLV
jgi:NitT/TauT family transport system permease protein